MQIIGTVFLAACAGWFTWSIWTLLRKDSPLFDNRRYYSDQDIDKRTYWAFIGFWIALTYGIYLPTHWLIGLVLPEHWGSYSQDDGEWSSYAQRISWLIAPFASLWMMFRMSKTGLSILQPEFWSSRFRPKEVTQCVRELDALKPLFEKVLCADTVFNRVEADIVSQAGRKDLLDSIRKLKYTPRRVVLQSLVQVARSILGSGELHVYRNVLNMEGAGAKSVFTIALREMVSSGFTNESEAAELRRVVEDEIKNIG